MKITRGFNNPMLIRLGGVAVTFTVSESLHHFPSGRLLLFHWILEEGRLNKEICKMFYIKDALDSLD